MYLCHIYDLRYAKRTNQQIQESSCRKQKSNKWLAEQLGKDQTTIFKWCTNTSQPDLGSLIKTAKLLGVELVDLVREENED